MATTKKGKPDYQQEAMPNMQEFFTGESEDEEWHEGPPRAGGAYFDAASLPDAPVYQPNAQGADVYMMYILFKDKKDLERGLAALTGGYRKGMSNATKVATISASHERPDGRSNLEHWEKP